MVSEKRPFAQYELGQIVLAVVVRNEKPLKDAFTASQNESCAWLWAVAEWCWSPKPQYRPKVAQLVECLRPGGKGISIHRRRKGMPHFFYSLLSDMLARRFFWPHRSYMERVFVSEGLTFGSYQNTQYIFLHRVHELWPLVGVRSPPSPRVPIPTLSDSDTPCNLRPTTYPTFTYLSLVVVISYHILKEEGYCSSRPSSYIRCCHGWGRTPRGFVVAFAELPMSSQSI